jgi:hypothetical protein
MVWRSLGGLTDGHAVCIIAADDSGTNSLLYKELGESVHLVLDVGNCHS